MEVSSMFKPHLVKQTTYSSGREKSVMAEWRQQVAGMVARAAYILNHKQKTESKLE